MQQEIFSLGKSAARKSQRYLAFSNADGKTWWMPTKHLRTAMNLYQPSGWKGKALKRILPLFPSICPNTFYCALAKDIENLLCGVFRQNGGIEFSVFFGTPSVHQKTILQLSKGNQILGYCKITEKREIADLFEREANLLENLRENGVVNIPKCLYSGELRPGIFVFVQSTVKTNSSKVLHCWEERHDAFLKEMHAKTKQTISFEESDFYGSLMLLKEHLDWLPDTSGRTTVEDLLKETLERFSGKIVEYSAYHADFTPWNMFAEKGQLFVFDWEYAGISYPPLLDRYHFFMQTAIFERHWNAEEIILHIASGKEKWMEREMLGFYLLDIISRYTLRERGNFKGDVMRIISVR